MLTYTQIAFNGVMPLIRMCGKGAGCTYHFCFELLFRPRYLSFPMEKNVR